MIVNCTLDLACEQNNVSNSNNPKGNNSNFPSYIKETFAVLVTKYTMLALLDIFGVIGNVIVVIVTTKRRAFNSSLDLFVKNLAVADLGFLVFIIPITVVRAEMAQWPFGEFACLYIYPFIDIFFGSSVWIIAAIAIERYRNIVGMARIHRRESQTKRSAKMLMLFVWLMSFVVYCVPVYVSVQYSVVGTNQKYCGLQWNKNAKSQILGHQIFIGFLVIFSYLLPLGIIIMTYIGISRQLNRSNTFLIGIRGILSRKNVKNKRQVQTVKSNDDESLKVTGCLGGGCQRPSSLSAIDTRRLTQNKRAKNILTPVAFLFALSMLPMNVLRSLLIFWTLVVIQPFYRIIFFIAIFCATANSSLNPLVYSIVSREFRNALKSIFFETKKKHFRNSSYDSTDHRKTELSGTHLGDAAIDGGGGKQNGSRLFLACNTKL